MLSTTPPYLAQQSSTSKSSELHTQISTSSSSVVPPILSSPFPDRIMSSENFSRKSLNVKEENDDENDNNLRNSLHEQYPQRIKKEEEINNRQHVGYEDNNRQISSPPPDIEDDNRIRNKTRFIQDNYSTYLENYTPPTPLYDIVNRLSFKTLCKRFEALYRQRKIKRTGSARGVGGGRKKEEKLELLFPRTLWDVLGGSVRNCSSGRMNDRDVNITSDSGVNNAGGNGDDVSGKSDRARVGESVFPLIRLMTPDRDSCRPHSGMKESSIASAWGDAIGLGKNSKDRLALTRYHDPMYASPSVVGDLSAVVKEVIEKRGTSSIKNNVVTTVGMINNWLDELAGVVDDQVSSSISTPNSMLESSSIRVIGGKGRHARRVQWVERRILSSKLSGLEHRWIVRIILQKMELGIGADSIIAYLHPWASGIYATNKNLRTLCATLCDSEFISAKWKYLEVEKARLGNDNRRRHLPRSHEPVMFGATISPMLSARTSFDKLLSDVGARHAAYVDSLPAEDPLRSNMSLKFPPFLCEEKFDGERIVAHVCRMGTVRLQTRNSVWYSNIYAPSLGPPLRKALAGKMVDVILDGEVVAWDDGRKEIIPFGFNRAVAKSRKEWLHCNGGIDTRDIDPHGENNDGLRVVTTGKDVDTDHRSSKKCWLKYVVFDVLYMSGPDASRIMNGVFNGIIRKKESSYIIPHTGSLLNLDLYQRRAILQALLSSQENEVEIAESIVIRPDGTAVDGLNYFSGTVRDHGISWPFLDSINASLDKINAEMSLIDARLRDKRSNKDIKLERAKAVERFYSEVVTRRCGEGIVVKDLCTPYGPGADFRNHGYWFKLKDDYERKGHAADVDVVVLGSSFATGMRKAGIPNSFLVGCLGPKVDGSKFLTLCQVSGGGIEDSSLSKLLTNTRFHRDTKTGKTDLGCWFQGDGKELPDFISNRSYQRSFESDQNGWKFRRKQYPDLWIRPEDSFVLTLNAGEIVSSSDQSAGVSLRFPRIIRVRAPGFEGGSKSIMEIEHATDLHKIYLQRQSQQREAEYETGNDSTVIPVNRFMHSRVPRQRKRARPLEVQDACIPIFRTRPQTVILCGYSFLVLEGKYSLNQESFDAEEAKEGGWYDDVLKVENRREIVEFIQRHGGHCDLTRNTSTDIVIGGQEEDARVIMYLRAADAEATRSRCAGEYRNVELNGVVKWNFLYGIVHQILIEAKTDKKLQNTINCGKEGNRIRELYPDMIQPRQHDYLGISKFSNKSSETKAELRSEEFEQSSSLDFCRSMADIGRIKRTKDSDQGLYPKGSKCAKGFFTSNAFFPWQYYDGISPFNKDEVWTFAGPQQKFWFAECNNNDDSLKKTIRLPFTFYPDLFDNSFGNDKDNMPLGESHKGEDSNHLSQISDRQKTSEIAAVLPLVKAMGGKITLNLHRDTTHVICNLLSNECLVYHHNVKNVIFHKRPDGNALLQRLRKLLDKDMTIRISLVSPQWIRNQWHL